MSITATEACSIEKILENDLISREIFAHLALPELLNLSLVNTAWMHIVRRYIRENLICDRNLPKNPSPCTSLIGLETELESMAIPHYTGIRIYLNRCLAHSATNFSCDDSYIDTMFQNILNRLNLKHIWLWFSSEKEYQVCTLAVKLVQSLCAKYGNSLKKITVIIKVFPSLCHPKRDPTLLRKIFLAGDDEKTVRYTNTKTLSFDCEYFRAETQNFLHDLIKASPRLGRIKCPNVDIVPEGWKHLVKEMVLNGDESRQWKYIDAKTFERKYELEYLMTFNCKFPDILLGFQEPSVIFEHLLWSSAESLKILSIRGSEFPRWSTNEKTPSLVNVEKLEIVTSLDDPLFLQEFGFICTVMCPGLKVVSIHHSLSMEGHRVERCENQGEIVPNGSVRTMRLEGFDREMDVMMCEFTKYFPNLTELHLIDCDGWGIQGIFNWTKLECIAFGRRNAYWTDNYDRFILGVESEEEMSELRKSWGSAHDLGNFAPTKPGLFSLTDLRRVYIMGGASTAGKNEDEQVFLSKEVVSLVAKKMPQLAIRMLKGYNDSVLSHLLEFDNGAENPWCPPVPHDVEQYFKYNM